MTTISVCIIVKNEEKVLKRCVDSIKGAYDELIIVDTGSTDKTVEIAKELGARVEHFEWVDDFAAARNYAYSFATGDWVMFMDADDILQEDHNKLLKSVIEKYDETSHNAISIPYIYSHEGIGTDEMPNFKYRQNRIIRRSAGPRWVGRIHEYLTFTGTTTVCDDLVFHHYRDEGKGTMNTSRNLRILQKALKNCPEHELPRMLFYHGKECMYHQKWDDAINSFERYIPLSNWVPEKHRAYYEMSVCNSAKKCYGEAVNCCLEAIKVDEDYCDPYVQLGMIAYEQERWGDVVKWMEAGLRTKTPTVEFFDFIPNKTYVPYDYLTIAYYKLGDLDNSLRCANKCLEYKPLDERYKKNAEIIIFINSKNHKLIT